MKKITVTRIVVCGILCFLIAIPFLSIQATRREIFKMEEANLLALQNEQSVAEKQMSVEEELESLKEEPEWLKELSTEKGNFTLEEYAMIVSEEFAKELQENPDMEVERMAAVKRLENEIRQRYMSTHEVTSDEEADELLNRFMQLAIEIVESHPRFAKEESKPVRTHTLDVLPAIPEGATGKTLEGWQGEQIVMLCYIIQEEELYQRKLAGLDCSPAALQDFYKTAFEFALNSCEISADGRTITVLEVPDERVKEHLDRLTALDPTRKTIYLTEEVAAE